MISFFRKIRQKLLQQNRVTRYLVYALGEIVLVTIGILIALQINTWNELRKDSNKEKLILQSLHSEFEGNKEKIQASIQHHEAILGCTKDLMKLFKLPDSTLKTHNLDSLIERSLDIRDLSTSQSAIEDLISSGNLNLISSENLRKLIFEWNSEIMEKNESFETLDETAQTLLLPYLIKNASLKNIDQYGSLNWKEKSKFDSPTPKMFQELEFENQLDSHAWGIANYLNALNVLREISEKIISESESTRNPER
ncbi:DUF6090 family protein [Algoriphagus algorifonticola]|uniref:DUF6090 family protein n=1 Tax=Algoriphagus algorifonticola TaxID=2593007 RepID=UPI0011A022DE|nr:DUF6090 family protein [Algoriphagus algorifonticola]